MGCMPGVELQKRMLIKVIVLSCGAYKKKGCRGEVHSNTQKTEHIIYKHKASK